MQEIHQKIADLESDVMSAEKRVIKYTETGHKEEVKKSLRQLESDLKYLSVLANGAPIDKNEDRRIMDFLRIHHNWLREHTAQMKYL